MTYHATYAANGMLQAQAGTRSGNYGANGKWEESGGLINDGFRFRDRLTDTFLTPDPAGFIDGPNTYNYVRHNPWSAWDPNGLAVMVIAGSLPLEPGGIGSQPTLATDIITPTTPFVGLNEQPPTVDLSSLNCNSEDSPISLGIKASDTLTPEEDADMRGRDEDANRQLLIESSVDLWFVSKPRGAAEIDALATTLASSGKLSPALARKLRWNSQSAADSAHDLEILSKTWEGLSAILGLVQPEMLPGKLLALEGAGEIAGVAKGASAAKGRASNLVNSRNLARQLTSEEQLAQAMAGKGEAIMGAGTDEPLWQSTTNKLCRDYGGSPADWAKMRSDSSATHGTTTPAGGNFETHWYQNIQTGQAVEFKTKILGH